MGNEKPFSFDDNKNIIPTGAIPIRYDQLREIMDELIPDSVTRIPLMQQASCLTTSIGQILNNPDFQPYIAGAYASGITNPCSIDLYITISDFLLNALDEELQKLLMYFVERKLDKGAHFQYIYKTRKCRLYILILPRKEDKSFTALMHRKKLDMAKKNISRGYKHQESGYFQMDLNDDEDIEDDD